MRTRVGPAMAGIALGLAIQGCGTAPAVPDGVAGPGTRAPTELEVWNENWQDMVIYAVAAGSERRLGQVNALDRRRFRLAPDLLGADGTIRLVADPIGSRGRHLTDRIVVTPGDRVRLTIENAIGLTSYTVLRRRE